MATNSFRFNIVFYNMHGSNQGHVSVDGLKNDYSPDVFDIG